MKTKLIIPLIILSSLTGGCGELGSEGTGKESKPTFMFWCFRKEVVESDYHVPDMQTDTAAGYIISRLKTIPGYVKSSHDLESKTITVHYSSSTVRYMNFEEGIAQAGFSVNNRPADPKAKIPEGVK